MQQFAHVVKAKVEGFPVSLSLPFLLGINTLALLALDANHAIPGWIKSAASLFLLF
jgi:hypothetical protein